MVAFFSPAQPAKCSLSDLMDKPRSQASALLPFPGSRLHI